MPRASLSSVPTVRFEPVRRPAGRTRPRRPRFIWSALGVLGASVLVAVLTFAGLMSWAGSPAGNPTGARPSAPAGAFPATPRAAAPAPTEPPVEEDTPLPSGSEPARPIPTSPATEPSVPAMSSTADAVAAAAQIGVQRGVRAAVVVHDRRTGATYVAGDVDYAYASASVVKVFIATRLLVDGRANDPQVKDQMWRMVTASDDAAAGALYPLAGSEGLAAWISARYHLSGISASPRPGYWGLTRITARAVVGFYAAVADDPAVGPWLLDAMGEGTRIGADGFNQYFGLMFVAHHWRVKQGWMCCLDDRMRMHSTGFVDDDRYVVALLTEGDRDKYYEYGRRTLSLMAQALLPTGRVVGSA